LSELGRCPETGTRLTQLFCFDLRSSAFIYGRFKKGRAMTDDPLRGRPLRKALRNWLDRHRDPFNFWIHLVGIPMAVAGLVLAVVWWEQWYWGAAAFVLGYVLQYIGHCVEGNDLGEWAGIKRLLGWPYVGIAPRWQQPAPPADAAPKPG
jgi:hypothetical protein